MDSFLQLNAIEARILACLIEKQAMTPEVYPLTVNAIVVACNQKTMREPTMHLELGGVTHALRQMETKGLVNVAPSSNRAVRYEHDFDAVYGVTPRQRAVLCLLMLRGPQTLNELLVRTERLARFPSADDLRDTLERLAQAEPPWIVRLVRASGQREDRYMHLLCGSVHVEASVISAPTEAATLAHADASLEARVVWLEAKVAELQQQGFSLQEKLKSIDVKNG